MSTFPHILLTAGCETPQKSDAPTNVPASASGLAGLFADVMAQALAPGSKQTLALTGQKGIEIDGKNTKLPKAEQTINLSNFYNSEVLSRQPASSPPLPEIGREKPEPQPNAFQSNSVIVEKIDGKSGESAKTNKDPHPQTEPAMVDVNPAEIPIHQMIAAVIPTVDLIPKSQPVSIPGARLAAPQWPARNAGATAYEVNSARSKPLPSAPAGSVDSLKNGNAASQPPAVSVAAPTTTEAAGPAATKTIPLLDAIKDFSPEEKPNVTSMHDTDSEPASGPQPPTPQNSPEINGISVAKQDTSVKQVDKTNNIAGTEKVLPGNTVLAAQGYSRLAGSVHMEQVAATVESGDQTPSNAPAAAAAVQAVSVPSTSNAGSLERTQEMISVNALRLSDSGNNSMQVVIKPDSGTQLSLELRQHGTSVEVQAVLQHGDFNHLSQQWPDLQHRLTQRGIQLAPLTDNGTAAHSASDGSFQQKQQQTTESAADLSVTGPAGLDVIPTIVSAPLIAHEPAQLGWETWA